MSVTVELFVKILISYDMLHRGVSLPEHPERGTPPNAQGRLQNGETRQLLC